MIAKLLLRPLALRRGRSIWLVLSLALPASLIVASSSIVSGLEQVFSLRAGGYSQLEPALLYSPAPAPALSAAGAAPAALAEAEVEGVKARLLCTRLDALRELGILKLAEGRLPEGGLEAALGSLLASELNATVGSKLAVEVGGRCAAVTVVGVLSWRSAYGDGLVAGEELASALRLNWTGVLMAVDAGSLPAELRGSLALGKGVVGYVELSAASVRSSIMRASLALSPLVFVSSFVAVSSLASEYRRELAVLAAVGVGRWFIAAVLAAQAMLLSAAAGLLGAALGFIEAKAIALGVYLAHGYYPEPALHLGSVVAELAVVLSSSSAGSLLSSMLEARRAKLGAGV